MSDGLSVSGGNRFSGTTNSEGRPDGAGVFLVGGSHSDHPASFKFQVEGTFKNGFADGDVKISRTIEGGGTETYFGSVGDDFAPKGMGVYTTEYGNRVTADFVHDSRALASNRGMKRYLRGRGVIELLDAGLRLEGDFRQMLPAGEVTISFAGDEFTGTLISPYIHDLPDEEKNIISGTIRYKDGRKYSGEMAVENTGWWPSPSGEGIMEYPSGRIEKGIFFGDKYQGDATTYSMRSVANKFGIPGLRAVAQPHWARHWELYALTGVSLAVLIWLLLRLYEEPEPRFSPIIVGAAFVSFGLVSVLALKRYQDRLRVLAATKTHVVFKQGMLSSRLIEIPIGTTLAIEVKRSLLGRLLGFGDVSILHDGSIKASASRIKNPDEFRNAVNNSEG